MAIPEVKNKNQEDVQEPEKITFDSEYTELSAEIAYDFCKESVEKTSVIDALKQKIGELETELKYFSSQIQSEKKIAENEKNVATRKLAHMTSEFKILQGKNEDQMKRMLELSSKISDFNTANRLQRARSDSLQSETVLKAEIKQLKSTIEKREIENKTLQSKNFELTEKIRSNETFINEMLFNKSWSLNHQIAENEKLHADNMEKTNRLNALNEKISEFDDDVKKIQASNDQKISLIQDLRSKIDKLEDKLAVNSFKHTMSQNFDSGRERAKSMSHFEFRQNSNSFKINFSPNKMFPSHCQSDSVDSNAVLNTTFVT